MYGAILILLIVLTTVLTLTAMAVNQFNFHNEQYRLQGYAFYTWLTCLAVLVVLYILAFAHWSGSETAGNVLLGVLLGSFALVVVWLIVLTQLKHHSIAKHQHLPQ